MVMLPLCPHREVRFSRLSGNTHLRRCLDCGLEFAHIEGDARGYREDSGHLVSAAERMARYRARDKRVAEWRDRAREAMFNRSARP